jgi:putative transposase
MTQDPADYPWSSYACNALGKTGLNGDWLQPHQEYLRLGQTAVERQLAYQQLFRTEITSADLAQIRDSTHKGWALGKEKFQAAIELLSKRQAVSKGIGRPRKKQGIVPPFNAHLIKILIFVRIPIGVARIL